jgi:hypothetical protein
MSRQFRFSVARGAASELLADGAARCVSSIDRTPGRRPGLVFLQNARTMESSDPSSQEVSISPLTSSIIS